MRGERGARRILVVDDTRASRIEAVELLESAGYDVVAVEDGVAAIKSLKSGSFDLLILDVVLPGLDGLEVLRLAKQHADGGFLPVLLTSVRGDVEARIRGLRLGADDFLASPFDPQELLARTESLLRIKEIHDRVEQAKAELERLSATDGLTGLLNHRALQGRLREELLRAQRYRHPLSVAILDLDHFKQVNDVHGHLIGDEVLAGFAELLRRSLRETDVIARYGGEEFVVLLPETGLEGARTVIERVRAETERTRFAAAMAGPLTTSAGISSFPAEGVSSPADLLRRADEALYRAKREGRNRVRFTA